MKKLSGVDAIKAFLIACDFNDIKVNLECNLRIKTENFNDP